MLAYSDAPKPILSILKEKKMRGKRNKLMEDAKYMQ
jgi:hypothetical protein